MAKVDTSFARNASSFLNDTDYLDPVVIPCLGAGTLKVESTNGICVSPYLAI
jgi:hypothetical protein